MSESETPTIRQSIVTLMTNWGKNGNAGKIDLWATMAAENGFTPEQVAAGVRKCIETWPGDNAPQGWNDFAPYLSKPKGSAKSVAWYSQNDGTWGGDWKGASPSLVLTVAAYFTASLKYLTKGQTESAEAFLKRARRIVSQADIDAASEAHLEKRLSRFIADWKEKRREQDQMADQEKLIA